MAEPTLTDLFNEMKKVSAKISTLEADVASLKEKAPTAESTDTRRADNQRDLEFHPKHKKWDFPHYDGTSDPMPFLHKCEAYFRQHRTMPEERVRMAAYHLDDAAQLWFIQLQEDEGTPSWGHFKDLLDLRFGPPLRSAPMFELAQCRRSGAVEEYANRFQALIPRAGQLDEAQRVQLFTGGLGPPLSNAVRIHHPDTLVAAISLARQVELMELDRPALPPPRAGARGPPPPPPAAARAVLPGPPPLLALPAPPAAAQPGRPEGSQRRLTQEEMADRRRLGLCFNCNERYTRGHNRFCRRIFFVEGVELEAEGEDAAVVDNAEAPCFSLQALVGVPMAGTMQITVGLGPLRLVALLDSGSTHNYIAEDAARRSGLPLHQRPRLTALVANGERVACAGVLRAAPLLVDGESFLADLFVMPLAGYDIVLGTHWLGALGAVVWDLSRQRLSFQRRGRTFSWTSVAPPSSPALRATLDTDSLLEALLLAYGGVFADPTGLPPVRAHDHRIMLKPDAQPVAVRPYRYPAAHKDELERQCAAMMEQGIVRRSDSPFSSPVLLVKKPDGSWRFCVDYRALNARTVKDAFPIPVVDELLDELHGAQFFTKLDLRSGYHQVRMRPEDIHKTAFRTHDGLYEFLVMAFGLCNAPATFQALMNDVLRPFLRRFVLVFFDDILIYSTTWADHLRHLRTVLDTLRRHQLFVKRSK